MTILATASGISDAISQFGPTSGVVGGVVLIVVTLLKSRPVERQSLSEDTAAHMNRLTRERDAAVDRAEGAEKARDEERELRRRAEDQSARAMRQADALKDQVAELTEEVKQLREQVESLINRPTGTGTPTGS